METTFFAFLFALSLLASIVLSIVLIREKDKTKELQSTITEFLTSTTPFKHWTRFSDGTYAIPLNCKLYQKNEDGILASTGTVSDHFEDFLDISREEVLEDYFYGDFKERKYLPIIFLSADSRSNEVLISSLSGKVFWIMRSNHSDFPDCIKISFKNDMHSQEVVESEIPQETIE